MDYDRYRCLQLLRLFQLSDEALSARPAIAAWAGAMLIAAAPGKHLRRSRESGFCDQTRSVATERVRLPSWRGDDSQEACLAGPQQKHAQQSRLSAAEFCASSLGAALDTQANTLRCTPAVIQTSVGTQIRLGSARRALKRPVSISA